MKVIDTINNILVKALAGIATICMAWMVISMLIQVFSRYIFNTGFIWTEETARYCMVWMVLFGAAVAIKEKGHIAITILEEKLRGWGRLALRVAQSIIMLAYAVILFWCSMQNMALATRQLSANLQIPMNYIYLVFPIASVCMAVFLVFIIIKEIRQGPQKKANKIDEEGGGTE